MAEDEPDDPAEPHHEVEGGQDDADGVHRRLELAAAPPQYQLHPGGSGWPWLDTRTGEADAKWFF